MQLLTIVAPVFATNCYIVAADDGTCVIVDAGAGVADSVSALVAERDLVPVAVLATHGHVDHTWDAAALSAEFDIPVRLHGDDAYRLDDPFGTLGMSDGLASVSGALAHALEEIGARPDTYRVPSRVETFGSGSRGHGRSADELLELGGVRLVARHAPGHTEGSTLYLLGADIALTGDVLFARGVGRTDLPGGNPQAMSTTLRDVVAALPPATAVLPGHGPASRIDIELAHNPYLTS